MAALDEIDLVERAMSAPDVPASDAMAAAEAAAVAPANALHANIVSKGSNAYYYAHATNLGPTSHIAYHEPPRLIARESPASGSASPSVRISPVSKYAWSDNKSSVSCVHSGVTRHIVEVAFAPVHGCACRVYVDLEGVGALPEDAVTVTTGSKSAEVRVYAGDVVHVLKLAPLANEIAGFTLKRKPDSIVVNLKKAEQMKWWELLAGGGGSVTGFDDE